MKIIYKQTHLGTCNKCMCIKEKTVGRQHAGKARTLQATKLQSSVLWWNDEMHHHQCMKFEHEFIHKKSIIMTTLTWLFWYLFFVWYLLMFSATISFIFCCCVLNNYNFMLTVIYMFYHHETIVCIHKAQSLSLKHNHIIFLL